MKNILLIFILGLALFSCDQENLGTLYEPETPYVAFSSPIVPENILSATNNYSVSVQIVRSDLSVATTATVSLEMNNSIQGVFGLESTTVTFAEGVGTAYVKVVPMVAPALIDPTKTYVFKLTLTGNNASLLYNKTTYKASFQYTPIGTGSFSSEAFEAEWPVDLEKLQVGDMTLYKAKDLYEVGYNVTIKVQGGAVTVDPQPAWFSSTYGDVYISGTGTINGKKLTMVIDHYIPNLGSYGEYNEILTLP